MDKIEKKYFLVYKNCFQKHQIQLYTYTSFFKACILYIRSCKVILTQIKDLHKI